MKKKECIKLFFNTIFVFSFCGCAAISGYQDSMNTFDNNLESKNCDYTQIEEKIKDNDDPILWGIQGGSLARNCFAYKKSNGFFDEAEEKYKQTVDEDTIFDNTLEASKSILVNNNANEYEGNIYEKVMVNTYKALNYASLHDSANTRVEFNRALDRQRRAKDYFRSEIQKKEANLEKENKEAEDTVYKQYDSLLNDFKAYPDFINPFTTYMAGVYFLLDGDTVKARDLLKESMEMQPSNKQIKSDYKLSNKYLDSSLRESKEKYAWIIYENGQGMIKDEIRIDIPLFIFSRNVIYTGIALPKIVERSSSYAYLDINGKDTTEVCNMDNVIKTEFKKRFPAILSEAIANTITKTITQKQLNDSSPLAGFLGFLYQSFTNRADVRSWTALPKNFQSLRVKLDGKPIEIKNNEGKIIKEVFIPNDKNALIYVKSQVIGNNIIHKILF
ncbi:putative lipoprotein [Arcobacter nitrofigilis DSM 7299]|uniref:Putative lipoprotein n=1 Tax=Arcobacter nitrofigilis (strain ATCC 33309 / DSM 7299 / CCUG 15893 / LMG 7604 / NCTC 12251 / CI) TaxID=572480 RepID=D5V791_ARCNC|nr:putative lipoprotein [Arcobacter nitrofigilis]ADG94511.1 putative lipoprotein [Arcobacter nitrofigilis DSM 7299]